MWPILRKNADYAPQGTENNNVIFKLCICMHMYLLCSLMYHRFLSKLNSEKKKKFLTSVRKI